MEMLLSRMGEHDEFGRWLLTDMGRLEFTADEALPAMHRELRELDDAAWGSLLRSPDSLGLVGMTGPYAPGDSTAS